MADSIGKIYVEISATANKLVNEVGKATQSLSLLQRSARSIQGTMIGMFGAQMVIGEVTSIINTIADFDQSMTSVKAITGAVGKDFDNLRNSAIKLGSTTQYTAQQVSELQLEFGRLGFSTKEILQSTKAVINLATATGEGLARSAEIAGSTLRAFQLDASEMGRVTDIMAGSLNNSALTLDSFAEGIKYVAPVAKVTNVSLEETSAMLSVLADAGIKGSQAGTSLRRIFTMLTADGRPLAERLKELSDKGLTLADANDEVGLYAQTALLQLSAMLPQVNKLTEEYKNNSGSAESLARVMEDNLRTNITKAKTSYDAFIISLSESKGILNFTASAIARIFQTLAGGDALALVEYEDNLKGLQQEISSGFKGAEKSLLKFEEKAKSLGKELIILRNESGKLTGVYERSFDGNVIVEAFDIQKDIAKNLSGITKTLLDYQRNKNKLDQESKDQLKQENEEYQNQIKLLNEIYRIIELGESIKRTAANFVAGAPGRSKQIRSEADKGNTPISAPVDNTISSLEEEVAKIKELQFNYEELRKTVKKLNDSKNQNIAAEADKMKSWAQSIEAVGDSIGRAIAADENLAISLSAITATIIEELERQTLAAILRNKVMSSGNIVLAAAAAAVGFSIVKGLFAKISKNKNGQSSANVSGGFTKTRSDYGFTITSRQRGTDLVNAGVEENRMRSRTRG